MTMFDADIADSNVKRLLAEAKLSDEGASFVRHSRYDDDDEYLGYTVSLNGTSTEVMMRDLPVEQWSVTDRCYIDGNAWMWKYAPAVLREALGLPAVKRRTAKRTAMRQPKAPPSITTLPQVMQLPQLPPPDERLAIVSPGPDVMLTPRATADIEEWVSGWATGAKLQEAGIPLPGPLLLHGPTGTGKTSVTRMIARRLEGVRAVLVIDAMRVLESWIGATSANISKAASAAVKSGGVLVLEEVDTLAALRMYGSGAELENARSTTAIMRVLELGGPMVLTSNRVDVLDPAVIRRCEYVVEMPEPTSEHRRAIVARELGVDPGFDFTAPLTEAIPLARRARRSAVLSGTSAVDVFGQLVSTRGGTTP